MSQGQLTFPDTPDGSAADVPQNTETCPPPGIYHDKPFEEYASWKAVNSGVIRWGLKTPRHFHAALEGRIRSDDTKDRKLGRAIHAMVLEPDTFAERYIVSGPCVQAFKGGPNKGQTCGKPGKFYEPMDAANPNTEWRWLCGQHGGDQPIPFEREVISLDDKRRCDGVVRSLKTLPPELVQMLSRPGFCEASIVWEHRGYTLKGRLDRLADSGDRPLVIDVKKIQVGAGDVMTCEKAILRYGYHVQAAIYVKGVQALKGWSEPPEFVWVFVEDDEPFDVQIIPAAPDVIEFGWDLVNKAITDAKSTDLGYIQSVNAIMPGGLPSWALRQWEESRNGIE